MLLHHIFAQHSTSEESLESFSQQAYLQTLAFFTEVVGAGDLLQEIELGLRAWQIDTAHGVTHSYWVFQQALHFATAEGISPSEFWQLRFLAIVHDMAEFLPLINNQFEVQVSEQEWRVKNHPQLMADLLELIDDRAGITDLGNLATIVRYHDASWNKPSSREKEALAAQLGLLGQVFSDADKLENGGSDSIEQAVAAYLDRNRQYSLGRWYSYRSDLTAADRYTWRVKTYGLYDNLAALVMGSLETQFLVYTQTGKQDALQKEQVFTQQLLHYYSQQYTQSWQVLAEADTVQVGLRVADEPVEIIETVQVDSFSRQDWQLLCQRVLAIEVKAKSTPERKYYGYSLLVADTWVDPSIAQFNSVEELQTCFAQVIAEYRAYIETVRTTEKG